MKAVVNDRYGAPQVLRYVDVDDPVAGEGEVLVRVRAAAVNPPDWAGVHGVPFVARMGFGLFRPRIPIRGTDLAGVVAAVGEKASRFAVGDEVFGTGVGTFAELAVAKQEHLVTKPPTLSFEQAAATGMAALTALQALRDAGRIQSGQQVLIVGAGGGIGTFAVQIAKALGAQVTGVCSESKRSLVLSLGADEVIDYAVADFTAGERRFDLVLDNVLQHPLSRLLRVVKRDGTLVPNGGQYYKRWIASSAVLLLQAPLLGLVVPQHIRVCMQRVDGADLKFLRDLVECGKLLPVVGRTYPLREAAEAIARFGDGHSMGKCILVPGG